MFKDMAIAAYDKGYISEDVRKTCMDALQEAQNDTALATDDSSAPVAATPSPKHAKDTCSCGKKLTSVRDRVACSNKVIYIVICPVVIID